MKPADLSFHELLYLSRLASEKREELAYRLPYLRRQEIIEHVEQDILDLEKLEKKLYQAAMASL